MLDPWNSIIPGEFISEINVSVCPANKLTGPRFASKGVLSCTHNQHVLFYNPSILFKFCTVYLEEHSFDP